MTYTDTNMDIDVQRAVQANQALADRIRGEAQQYISPTTSAALLAAQDTHRDAKIAYQVAQQPPQPIGDARERALARIEWEEKMRDARSAYIGAEQALTRAQAAFDMAERDILSRMLREADVNVSRIRSAIQAKVGGAWSAQQANGMLAADPGLSVLLAEGSRADERLALLTKAVRTLFQ